MNHMAQAQPSQAEQSPEVAAILPNTGLPANMESMYDPSVSYAWMRNP